MDRILTGRRTIDILSPRHLRLDDLELIQVTHEQMNNSPASSRPANGYYRRSISTTPCAPVADDLARCDVAGVLSGGSYGALSACRRPTARSRSSTDNRSQPAKSSMIFRNTMNEPPSCAGSSSPMNAATALASPCGFPVPSTNPSRPREPVTPNPTSWSRIANAGASRRRTSRSTVFNTPR